MPMVEGWRWRTSCEPEGLAQIHIGKNRIAHLGKGTTLVLVSVACPGKWCPVGSLRGQVRAPERIGLEKIALARGQPGEIRQIKITFGKGRLPVRLAPERSAPKHRPREIGVTEIGAAQIRAREIDGPGEIGPCAGRQAES